MGHASYWIESTIKTSYPKLKKRNTEIAVIGGGIAGLTTAHLLAEKGLDVVLLESRRIIQGTTGHTTAKITSNHGFVYRDLISSAGEPDAQAYADANQAAISMIKKQAKGIDCDLHEAPSYTYSISKQPEEIKKEATAASQLGLPAEYTEEVPLPFKTNGAVIFRKQARFHPRKYLLGIASQTKASIWEQTRVYEVDEKKDNCTLTTSEGKLTADHVIHATQYPFIGAYYLELYPYRSMVIAAKIKETFQDAMIFENDKPYHSFRIQPDRNSNLLIIGGEDYRVGREGDVEQRYLKLERFARKHFTCEKIEYSWSAQDNNTPDKMPFIGKHSPRQYIATGFNGWGMTNGTAAAMLIRELIMTGKSPWEKAFDPKRVRLGNIPQIIKSNIKQAREIIKGKLRGSDKKHQEGTIISKGIEKTGLYEDNQGKMRGVSVTCTHLGCTLSWNDAEKTWDCPCHGSRFEKDGKMLHAPATKDLEKKKI